MSNQNILKKVNLLRIDKEKFAKKGPLKIASCIGTAEFHVLSLHEFHACTKVYEIQVVQLA